MTFNIPAIKHKGVVRNQEIDTTIAYNQHKRYRSGIGSLLYLVGHSQIELSNTVRELSKYMGETNMSHYKAILRAIKYLVDRKEYF